MDVQVHFSMFYLMFFKLTSLMTSCFRFCISQQPSGRCGAFKVQTVHFLRSAGSEVQQVQQVQQVQLHHPGAYHTLLKSFTAGTQTWRFGRLFSLFQTSDSSGSMFIFRGFPIGWGWKLHTKKIQVTRMTLTAFNSGWVYRNPLLLNGGPPSCYLGRGPSHPKILLHVTWEKKHEKLVGGFKYCLFSPLFGGMIHFD